MVQFHFWQNTFPSKKSRLSSAFEGLMPYVVQPRKSRDLVISGLHLHLAVNTAGDDLRRLILLLHGLKRA